MSVINKELHRNYFELLLSGHAVSMSAEVWYCSCGLELGWENSHRKYLGHWLEELGKGGYDIVWLPEARISR